jgi:ABC-2 type transport system ATP-binding protein
MTAPAPAAGAPAPAAAIEARGLVRRFGSVEALRGLTFRVNAGELYGLVGPDGAGKTTAIRVLAGLLDADGGEARVLGRDPARAGAAAREAIGLMPQQFSLYRDLTVGENLAFFARLHGVRGAAFRERSARLLALARLEPFVERRAGALSGGMYKKLALACALLHDPAVLLLDEPTNGVDPVSRRELWALLHELVHGGTAVLVSTPYMDEPERCDRVGLVHEGRLLAEGAPDALLAASGHRGFEELFLARFPEDA